MFTYPNTCKEVDSLQVCPAECLPIHICVSVSDFTQAVSYLRYTAFAFQVHGPTSVSFIAPASDVKLPRNTMVLMGHSAAASPDTQGEEKGAKEPNVLWRSALKNSSDDSRKSLHYSFIRQSPVMSKIPGLEAKVVMFRVVLAAELELQFPQSLTTVAYKIGDA